MFKLFKPILAKVDGIESNLRGYAFQIEKGEIRLIQDKVLTSELALTEPGILTNCFESSLSHSSAVRSGAVDSVSKANQLILLIKKVHDHLKQANRNPSLPLRAVSIQLNAPEAQWDLVTAERESIASIALQYDLKDHLVHLNLPFDFYFKPSRPEMYVAATIRNIRKLSKLKNMEAWAAYCLWLNEDLEFKFKSFLADAIDEYQLEARFKDFRHETHSGLLFGSREQALDLNRQIEQLNALVKKGERDSRSAAFELESLEKDLLRAQGEIKSSIHSQYSLLHQIEAGIEKVEQAHPELLDIKNKVLLTRKLLDNQLEIIEDGQVNKGLEIMTLALLNEQLGVLSCYNCDLGLERTSFAFALGFAILQLRERSSMTRIMDMLTHWEATVQEINKIFAQKGIEGFHAWLKQKSSNENENILQKRAAVVMKFRHLVLFNLYKISYKIAEFNIKKQRVRPLIKEKVEYLNFLPPFHDILNEKGVREVARIYKTDSLTGAPTGLTPHGNHLLMPLSDI